MIAYHDLDSFSYSYFRDFFLNSIEVKKPKKSDFRNKNKFVIVKNGHPAQHKFFFSFLRMTIFKKY